MNATVVVDVMKMKNSFFIAFSCRTPAAVSLPYGAGNGETNICSECNGYFLMFDTYEVVISSEHGLTVRA
jgi:hypothetical protein